MNKKTWIIIAAAIVAVLLWPLTDRSMSACAQTKPVITIEKGTFDEDIPDMICINEDIHATYNWNSISRVTFNANGKPHLGLHVNFSNVKAIGLETGTIYTGSYAENWTANRADFDLIGEPPWVVTINFVSNGLGRGSAPNFHLKGTDRTTVNANGETTNELHRFILTCE